MNRDAYLQDPDVVAFLEWVKPFVTGDRPLDHCWTSPRWGTRRFRTLFDAYENYEWKFRVGGREGKNYAETVAFLDGLRKQLRESVEQGDAAFLEAALEVVRWGKVSEKPLRKLNREALPRLTANARLLDPATADLDSLSAVDLMNSGFSKIYSLLIDGFPIYDSRVACAIASLVWLFCHDCDRDAVPETLRIAIPPYQPTVRRNPSCGRFRFPKVYTRARYARSNVMAAWLLSEMTEQAPFPGADDPLHALQSAMFMVGYAPLDRPCPSPR